MNTLKESRKDKKEMKTKMKINNTILYLLNKMGPMTKDKLETLLYFIDFDYYEKYDKPFFKNIRWIKGKKHPELNL